ncbi:serine hydrolase [Winogradskyella sp. 3972H.M.0a.05]|uniref:serine hydrolase domain-containing protein n=1 Tax=Winogradskyella sp. 3972H.M.0a.05 TaxID=2950277 RepID=UPI003390B1DC
MKKIGVFAVLCLLFSCNSDDDRVEQVIEIFVGEVTNIILQDVADSGDSSDFQLDFDKADDESMIAEYRVMLVKDGNDITLEEALEIQEYWTVSPTGSDFQNQLPANLNDIDGDAVVNAGVYKAYILSKSNNESDATSSLSKGLIGTEFVDNIANLEALIAQEMNAWNINALSIALINEGEVIYSKGFGMHDLANQTEATDETLFVTSSMAKLIIATAVMQQVEQGAIDLDEEVSTYLGYEFRNPNFPNVPVTVRQLMTQRSSLSLPTFGEIPDLAAIYSWDSAASLPFSTWVPNYLLTTGANYDPDSWRNYPPDTQHLSSNTGMALLAYMVELVSGVDFRDYADENIFAPLGMNNTSYRMDIPGSYDDTLLADIFTSTGNTFPDYIYKPDYPAGLLRTSTSEWSNFLIAILNRGILNGNRILEESTVDLMLDVQYPDANLAYGAGVALIWRSLNGWIGHTAGGFVTGSTDVKMEGGKGVVIISNGRQAFTVVPDSNNGLIYNFAHEYLNGL